MDDASTDTYTHSHIHKRVCAHTHTRKGEPECSFYLGRDMVLILALLSPPMILFPVQSLDVGHVKEFCTCVVCLSLFNVWIIGLLS